ncbi:hypothetical protein [Tropicibacter oceani]|uniref:Uncharacterized protein n=1 Tax=Tropicibacter oceani TaxID=3058420 RepID=A0ABY8QLB2_9RHOB|nr:hypothetical protein [Tropicibacter oceani]WGW05420.1 hypothetical protein QF118_07700 [Tropicibacter oceani]
MTLRKLILFALALSLLGLAGALAADRLTSAVAMHNTARALSAFFFAAVLVLLAGLALLSALRKPRIPPDQDTIPAEAEHPQT